MKKKSGPETPDSDLPALDAAWFFQSRPARDVLPPAFFTGVAQMKKTRGAQKAPKKKPVSIRLDPDVLKWFKQQGRGYQIKINQALREYIRDQR